MALWPCGLGGTITSPCHLVVMALGIATLGEDHYVSLLGNIVNLAFPDHDLRDGKLHVFLADM